MTDREKWAWHYRVPPPKLVWSRPTYADCSRERRVLKGH